MCNLYRMAPKDAVEVYLRKIYRQVDLPGYEPVPVGPFGIGLFVRAARAGEGVEGALGQWGMIRLSDDGREAPLAIADVVSTR